MKQTIRIAAEKLLACLLAAALLLSVGAFAFAKNGPYVPEAEDGWNYARLELVELDENGQPIEVISEEYGYPVDKALPLYTDGKATAQPGAVYDPAANTLTLTDFKGNYMLRAVLMGDDFTVCVRGECALAGVEVHGGGYLYPRWGSGLRFTGDGTLTLNAGKKLERGILLAPQEEDAFSLTVAPEVTLNVYGSRTAIEAWGFTGEFTMTVDGKTETVKGEKAQRMLAKSLDGYSNPMTWDVPLGKNAADPTGFYSIAVHTPVIWVDDDFVPDPEKPPFVVVERYIYLASLDLYVRDYDWEKAHSTSASAEEPDEVRFADMEAAAAAGFTPVTDGEGKQVYKEIKYLGNSGSEEIYRDAEGKEYAVGFGPDDEGNYDTVAMTITPIEELPGKYVFTYAKGVDPATLTEIMENKTFDDTFDYAYPEKTFTHKAASSEEPAFTLGDVDGDGEVTAADARDALRASVKLENYASGSREFLAADVDKDNALTSADARLILRRSVGIRTDKDWNGGKA